MAWAKFGGPTVSPLKQQKNKKTKTALRPFQLEPHLLTGNTPRQQQLNFLKVLKISEIIEKCKNQKQT